MGKNGGTALQRWLEENELQCLFSKRSFEHIDMQTEFASRPRGACYVTLVRDPVVTRAKIARHRYLIIYMP